MKIFKNIIVVVFSTLCVLILIELIAYCLTNIENRKYTFFVNLEFSPSQSWHGKMYDRIDPLLGWTFNQSFLDQSGFNEKYDIIILNTNQINCQDTLNILLTGGSTSDVVLDPYNWPLFFHKKLEEMGVCANVKVAAVGGYNSGQELLKLQRDLSIINPDIHISYSGANEAANSRYVSDYEENIFKSQLNKGSKVMPYAINILLRTLDKGNFKAELNTKYPGKYPSEFWKQNMTYMQAISNQFEYKFIGVLQPVLGVGPHANELNEVIVNDKSQLNNDHLETAVAFNIEFYKDAIESCAHHEFLIDFTGIFADEENTPFVDDCHIKKEYNLILANHMVKLLDQKGYLLKQKAVEEEY